MGLTAELGGQVRLVGAAGAGAGGVAALRHEAVDNAVEDDAVVEAFARQLTDARDMLGREVRAQADDHVAAAVEVEDQGVEIVGHGILLGEPFACAGLSVHSGVAPPLPRRIDRPARPA